ncbi:hypothetical protein EYF80_027368 [Liparis tanakae]|uniref:Uncharacterized protein n=1 Tax=Liparis tanakae TaxID=230148 RepID=A0A4Z2HAB6_9TELE|nr:hypothetical protein EYF80_027368 [Liparis tanakae]
MRGGDWGWGGGADDIISFEAWRASASLGSCRAALRRRPTAIKKARTENVSEARTQRRRGDKEPIAQD